MSAVTRRLPRLWWLGAAVLVLLAISVLRVVTGAEDLASSGTVRATLIALVPIMLAGLGGLWSERAGVVNIGLEGMMVLGTYGAGYFGYHYGAWAGVAGALLMGAILSSGIRATQGPSPSTPRHAHGWRRLPKRVAKHRHSQTWRENVP